MSQPADPYRQRPRQPGYPPPPGRQAQYQPHDPYQHGRYQEPPRQPYQPPHQPPHQPPYQPPYQPPRRPGPSIVRRFAGPGLVLIVVALVIQLLSLTVLPWEDGGLSLPRFWQRTTDQGTSGFGDWYVVLFGYPLAALSILLALASVLESVAIKLVWGGLAVVGLGVLVLRYGLGPFADLAAGRGLDFTTQEITIATVAVGALVLVIFLLRMAVTTFRRVAGLVLLGVSGVHVAAVSNLTEQLSIGAYGPAAGYLLTAIAAFLGPRRF